MSRPTRFQIMRERREEAESEAARRRKLIAQIDALEEQLHRDWRRLDPKRPPPGQWVQQDDLARVAKPRWWQVFKRRGLA
jgi:hypothetical protein